MTDRAAPHPELKLRREGRVAIVSISNPDARNALVRVMFERGQEIFRSLRQDPDIGAIVLHGEGEHFCGGGNIKRMIEQRGKPRHTQAEHVDALHAWIIAMRECTKPVIAAVEGAAAGGGFALALSCDLIVASERATLLMSHAKIGLSPDCGASYWLARALPHQAALEIMLDAQPIPVSRLHQLGVVNRVVAPGQALAGALDWAAKLALGPAVAQGRIKRLIYEAERRSLREQLDIERDWLVESMYADECGEGIQAFVEKRPARFAP